MQPFCRELQAAGMLDLTNPSWLSKHRRYTHPIKEDVKKKYFSAPLWGDVDVVTCIQPRLISWRGRWFGRFGSPRISAAIPTPVVCPNLTVS